MGHKWQDGETITAALLNGVAQIADLNTPGTPAGDAVRAAFAAGYAAAGGLTGGLTTEAGDALTTEAGDVLITA